MRKCTNDLPMDGIIFDTIFAAGFIQFEQFEPTDVYLIYCIFSKT